MRVQWDDMQRLGECVLCAVCFVCQAAFSSPGVKRANAPCAVCGVTLCTRCWAAPCQMCARAARGRSASVSGTCFASHATPRCLTSSLFHFLFSFARADALSEPLDGTSVAPLAAPASVATSAAVAAARSALLCGARPAAEPRGAHQVHLNQVPRPQGAQQRHVQMHRLCASLTLTLHSRVRQWALPRLLWRRQARGSCAERRDVLLTSDLLAATGCRAAACGAASCCARLGFCAPGQGEVDTQFWESVCIQAALNQRARGDKKDSSARRRRRRYCDCNRVQQTVVGKTRGTWSSANWRARSLESWHGRRNRMQICPCSIRILTCDTA